MFGEFDEEINILILLLISIFIIIVFIISIFNGEYNDYYYENIKNNWSKSPIIEITTTNPNSKPDESTAFLGYYKKNKNSKTYIWKNKHLKLKRMNSQYNYPSLYNYNQTEKKKKCGKDSLGNYLYFPINEKCPINLITNKRDNKYNYNEIKFNSFSLYYTNECIECTIIVDFRVSIQIGPSFDELNGGDICSLLSCNFTKPNDYDDLSYTKIDSMNGKDFLLENSVGLSEIRQYYTNLYLHTRSYVGVYDSDTFSYRENKLLNRMLNIRKQILIKNIICPIIIIIVIIIKFYELVNQVGVEQHIISDAKIWLIQNFFIFIFLLFVLIYVGYYIFFFYNIKNNVILKMNSPIVYYYYTYTNIMTLNIVVEFLLFFIFFYLLISFIHVLTIDWKWFKYNFWIFELLSGAQYEKKKEVLELKKRSLDQLYNDIDKEVKLYEKKLNTLNKQYNNLDKEDKQLNKKLSLIDEIQQPMEKNKKLKIDKDKKEKIKKEYEKYKNLLLEQNILSLDDYECEIIKKENIENDLKILTNKINVAKKKGNKEIIELNKMKKGLEDKIIEIENRLKFKK